MWKCFAEFKEKHDAETGPCLKATRNRSQQESRLEGYLCNDCHKSPSTSLVLIFAGTKVGIFRGSLFSRYGCKIIFSGN